MSSNLKKGPFFSCKGLECSLFTYCAGDKKCGSVPNSLQHTQVFERETHREKILEEKRIGSY